jgi:predicted Rossmann fold nucleotide-binding protein DprA/Smf involved in DNA uptake
MHSRTLALHLALTPGIGGKSVSRILTRNNLLGREPEEFLALSPEALREEYRLNSKASATLASRRLEDTQEIESRLAALGVTLATTADAGYPERIEQMDPDPPGVVFLYGNAKLLSAARTFCVVSSRNSFPAELDMIEKLTEEAVLDGGILVTGHDRPEYQRSAIVPLRWGSPRILCLDRGLFKVLGDDLRDEAFRAARLWRYEFDPKTDLVVSPFRPESDFIGENNRIRDRMVGCLSMSLSFVKIDEGGNMERLVKLALKAGRQVQISDRSVGYRKFVDLGAEAIPS